ncbi:MAG: hypothetical protein MRY83_17055 [Flavobacteriales bacterium]|nr:hypothetical protein [Flavobacteriales bacterium]
MALVKTIVICFLFAFTVFIAMLGVNWGHKGSHDYDPNQCSRYCHDKGCYHIEKKFSDSTGENWFKLGSEVYRKNILLLKNNGLGLSYKEINLLIYVLLLPIIAFLLLFNLVRKWKYQRR